MENNDRIKNSMIEIAVEHYRLKKTFMKAISKLDFVVREKPLRNIAKFNLNSFVCLYSLRFCDFI